MTDRGRRRSAQAIAAALVTLAACGRRESPAWFDAQPPPNATVPAAPLPLESQQLQWHGPGVPIEAVPGQTLAFDVQLTNLGTQSWPDNALGHPLRDGRYAVRISYAWARTGQPAPQREQGHRINLPGPMPAGGTARIPVKVEAPAESGDFDLVLDVLQELVQWFGDNGAPALRIAVRVRSR